MSTNGYNNFKVENLTRFLYFGIINIYMRASKEDRILELIDLLKEPEDFYLSVSHKKERETLVEGLKKILQYAYAWEETLDNIDDNISKAFVVWKENPNHNNYVDLVVLIQNNTRD